MDRLWTQRKLSATAKIQWLDRMSDLLEQGYSFMETLNILQASSSATEQYWLQRMCTVLENGHAVEIAFQEAQFSEYVVLMVAQANVHGHLSAALAKASDWQKKRRQLQREWKKILAYPLVLLIVVAVILYMIIFVVLPQFQVLFDVFDLSLPSSTQHLLNSFTWLQNNAIILSTAMTLPVVCLYLLWSKVTLRVKIIHKLLYVPGIKFLLQSVYTVLFSIQLGFLLQAGIPMNQSLTKLKERSSSPVLHQKVTEIEAKMMSGKTLGEAIAHESLFTQELYPVIYYAERNGQLARQLFQYGIHLERAVIEQWMSRLKWVEPVLLLGIGGLIAFIFMALFTPITQLMNQM